MKRVAAAAGLGLAWFAMVAGGALMAGHSHAGLSVVVIILLGGPLLLGFLLVQATEEVEGFGVTLLWLAWIVAAFAGMIATAGGELAYEPSFGQPETVIVMDTRCLPDSDNNGCDSQVRVSTTANERDLGWLMDCEPLHAPGQPAEVLVDPHGWFQPQVSTCAAYGRGFGLFVLGAAGYVGALTLVQAAWLAWLGVRESRRVHAKLL